MYAYGTAGGPSEGPNTQHAVQRASTYSGSHIGLHQRRFPWRVFLLPVANKDFNCAAFSSMQLRRPRRRTFSRVQQLTVDISPAYINRIEREQAHKQNFASASVVSPPAQKKLKAKAAGSGPDIPPAYADLFDLLCECSPGAQKSSDLVHLLRTYNHSVHGIAAASLSDAVRYHPLHCAIHHGWLAGVAFLVAAGGDPSKRGTVWTYNGDDLAYQHGDPNITRVTAWQLRELMTGAMLTSGRGKEGAAFTVLKDVLGDEGQANAQTRREMACKLMHWLHDKCHAAEQAAQECRESVLQIPKLPDPLSRVQNMVWKLLAKSGFRLPAGVENLPDTTADGIPYWCPGGLFDPAINPLFLHGKAFVAPAAHAVGIAAELEAPKHAHLPPPPLLPLPVIPVVAVAPIAAVALPPAEPPPTAMIALDEDDLDTPLIERLQGMQGAGAMRAAPLDRNSAWTEHGAWVRPPEIGPLVEAVQAKKVVPLATDDVSEVLGSLIATLGGSKHDELLVAGETCFVVDFTSLWAAVDRLHSLCPQVRVNLLQPKDGDESSGNHPLLHAVHCMRPAVVRLLLALGLSTTLKGTVHPYAGDDCGANELRGKSAAELAKLMSTKASVGLRTRKSVAKEVAAEFESPPQRPARVVVAHVGAADSFLGDGGLAGSELMQEHSIQQAPALFSLSTGPHGAGDVPVNIDYSDEQKDAPGPEEDSNSLTFDDDGTVIDDWEQDMLVPTSGAGAGHDAVSQPAVARVPRARCRKPENPVRFWMSSHAPAILDGDLEHWDTYRKKQQMLLTTLVRERHIAVEGDRTAAKQARQGQSKRRRLEVEENEEDFAVGEGDDDDVRDEDFVSLSEEEGMNMLTGDVSPRKVGSKRQRVGEASFGDKHTRNERLSSRTTAQGIQGAGRSEGRNGRDVSPATTGRPLPRHVHKKSVREMEVDAVDNGGRDTDPQMAVEVSSDAEKADSEDDFTVYDSDEQAEDDDMLDDAYETGGVDLEKLKRFKGSGKNGAAMQQRGPLHGYGYISSVAASRRVSARALSRTQQRAGTSHSYIDEFGMPARGPSRGGGRGGVSRHSVIPSRAFGADYDYGTQDRDPERGESGGYGVIPRQVHDPRAAAATCRLGRRTEKVLMDGIKHSVQARLQQVFQRINPAGPFARALASNDHALAPHSTAIARGVSASSSAANAVDIAATNETALDAQAGFTYGPAGRSAAAVLLQPGLFDRSGTRVEGAPSAPVQGAAREGALALSMASQRALPSTMTSLPTGGGFPMTRGMQAAADQYLALRTAERSVQRTLQEMRELAKLVTLLRGSGPAELERDARFHRFGAAVGASSTSALYGVLAGTVGLDSIAAMTASGLGSRRGNNMVVAAWRADEDERAAALAAQKKEEAAALRRSDPSRVYIADENEQLRRDILSRSTHGRRVGTDNIMDSVRQAGDTGKEGGSDPGTGISSAELHEVYHNNSQLECDATLDDSHIDDTSGEMMLSDGAAHRTALRGSLLLPPPPPSFPGPDDPVWQAPTQLDVQDDTASTRGGGRGMDDAQAAVTAVGNVLGPVHRLRQAVALALHDPPNTAEGEDEGNVSMGGRSVSLSRSVSRSEAACALISTTELTALPFFPRPFAQPYWAGESFRLSSTCTGCALRLLPPWHGMDREGQGDGDGEGSQLSQAGILEHQLDRLHYASLQNKTAASYMLLSRFSVRLLADIERAESFAETQCAAAAAAQEELDAYEKDGEGMLDESLRANILDSRRQSEAQARMHEEFATSSFALLCKVLREVLSWAERLEGMDREGDGLSPHDAAIAMHRLLFGLMKLLSRVEVTSPSLASRCGNEGDVFHPSSQGTEASSASDHVEGGHTLRPCRVGRYTLHPRAVLFSRRSRPCLVSEATAPSPTPSTRVCILSRAFGLVVTVAARCCGMATRVYAADTRQEVTAVIRILALQLCQVQRDYPAAVQLPVREVGEALGLNTKVCINVQAPVLWGWAELACALGVGVSGGESDLCPLLARALLSYGGEEPPSLSHAFTDDEESARMRQRVEDAGNYAGEDGQGQGSSTVASTASMGGQECGILNVLQTASGPDKPKVLASFFGSGKAKPGGHAPPAAVPRLRPSASMPASRPSDLCVELCWEIVLGVGLTLAQLCRTRARGKGPDGAPLPDGQLGDGEGWEAWLARDNDDGIRAAGAADGGAGRPTPTTALLPHCNTDLVAWISSKQINTVSSVSSRHLSPAWLHSKPLMASGQAASVSSFNAELCARALHKEGWGVCVIMRIPPEPARRPRADSDYDVYTRLMGVELARVYSCRLHAWWSSVTPLCVTDRVRTNTAAVMQGAVQQLHKLVHVMAQPPPTAYSLLTHGLPTRRPTRPVNCTVHPSPNDWPVSGQQDGRRAEGGGVGLSPLDVHCTQVLALGPGLEGMIGKDMPPDPEMTGAASVVSMSPFLLHAVRAREGVQDHPATTTAAQSINQSAGAAWSSWLRTRPPLPSLADLDEVDLPDGEDTQQTTLSHSALLQRCRAVRSLVCVSCTAVRGLWAGMMYAAGLDPQGLSEVTAYAREEGGRGGGISRAVHMWGLPSLRLTTYDNAPIRQYLPLMPLPDRVQSGVSSPSSTQLASHAWLQHMQCAVMMAAANSLSFPFHGARLASCTACDPPARLILAQTAAVSLREGVGDEECAAAIDTLRAVAAGTWLQMAALGVIMADRAQVGVGRGGGGRPPTLPPPVAALVSVWREAAVDEEGEEATGALCANAAVVAVLGDVCSLLAVSRPTQYAALWSDPSLGVALTVPGQSPPSSHPYTLHTPLPALLVLLVDMGRARGRKQGAGSPTALGLSRQTALSRATSSLLRAAFAPLVPASVTSRAAWAKVCEKPGAGLIVSIAVQAIEKAHGKMVEYLSDISMVLSRVDPMLCPSLTHPTLSPAHPCARLLLLLEHAWGAACVGMDTSGAAEQACAVQVAASHPALRPLMWNPDLLGLHADSAMQRNKWELRKSQAREVLWMVGAGPGEGQALHAARFTGQALALLSLVWCTVLRDDPANLTPFLRRTSLCAEGPWDRAGGDGGTGTVWGGIPPSCTHWAWPALAGLTLGALACHPLRRPGPGDILALPPSTAAVTGAAWTACSEVAVQPVCSVAALHEAHREAGGELCTGLLYAYARAAAANPMPLPMGSMPLFVPIHVLLRAGLDALLRPYLAAHPPGAAGDSGFTHGSDALFGVWYGLLQQQQGQGPPLHQLRQAASSFLCNPWHRRSVQVSAPYGAGSQGGGFVPALDKLQGQDSTSRQAVDRLQLTLRVG